MSGGYKTQVTVLPIQKVSQTLVKANLRPKNICLGLIKCLDTLGDKKFSRSGRRKYI